METIQNSQQKEDPPFGAWNTWVATDAPRRLRPTTIRDYQWQLERFTQWLVRTLDLPWTANAITAYRVETYARSLEHRVEQHDLAPATYNKTVAALTSFGDWLVVAGHAVDNPARRLRSLPEQPRAVRSLQPSVVRKVLDAAHHTGQLRDAVVLEILAHTGMRAHEVAAMQVTDLDVGPRTTWVRILGKGAKQRRVPLPKHVGLIIQDYLTWRAAREGHRPTAGPVLVGERGGITRTTINRIVRNVTQGAQLAAGEQAHVTPHAFRHTVATRVARTRDLVIAADLLGHGSLATTRRYTKASSDEMAEAVEHLYDERRHAGSED